MQGASWFSQNHQRQRNPQLEELACTLARRDTLNIAPLMRSETPMKIASTPCAASAQYARERILDAGVYDEQGDPITSRWRKRQRARQAGAGWQKAGSYFNQQIVEPIRGKTRPL